MTTQGPGPVPTKGIGSSNSFGPPTAVGEWDMRQFADRAFRMLQGHSEPLMGVGGQLTDVEIIDEQGRMAYARCRAVGSGVEITVKANAGPTLSVGDSDDIRLDDSLGPRQAANPQQVAFESYWAGAHPRAAGERREQVARAAFLAGQVDNSVDTRQAAFETYWMDAGHLSPESYEKCAHAAFLAGLVAQP